MNFYSERSKKKIKNLSRLGFNWFKKVVSNEFARIYLFRKVNRKRLAKSVAREFFPNFRYSLSSHLSRERKKLLSLFQSIIIHVSIVTHRDDLTRRLRNLYTAGIYRSIRSGEQRNIHPQRETHNGRIFAILSPLLAVSA